MGRWWWDVIFRNDQEEWDGMGWDGMGWNGEMGMGIGNGEMNSNLPEGYP